MDDDLSQWELTDTSDARIKKCTQLRRVLTSEQRFLTETNLILIPKLKYVRLW